MRGVFILWEFRCGRTRGRGRGGTLSAAGERTRERMRMALGARDAVVQAGAAAPHRDLVRETLQAVAGEGDAAG